ncbi:MAG: DUF4214 domain-containing protein [Pseudomonadota bacterium]
MALACACVMAACGSRDAVQHAQSSAQRAAVAAAPALGDYNDIVQQIYVAYFGRPADPDGQLFWSTLLANARAPTDLTGFNDAYHSNPTVKLAIDGFGQSQESVALYGSDNGAVVNAIYLNLFNRPAEAGGAAFWTAQLNAGTMTRAQAALIIAGGALGSDATSVQNKRAAAAQFTDAIGTPLQGTAYSGLAANQSVRLALASVSAGSNPATGQASMLGALDALANGILNKSQLVWFSPLDPATRTWGNFVSGSSDFMDLFDANAAWAQAVSHVGVFKMQWNVFIDNTLPNSLTDSQIRVALAELDRRGIALGVELEALSVGTDPAHCGSAVEGFGSGYFDMLTLATRIRDLGGKLKYVAMDEPFQHDAAACKWTAREIAENAHASLAAIRTIFPDVKIGDVEVVPDTMDAPDWLARYVAWFDAWRDVWGEPLAFFHADLDWALPYKADLKTLASAAAQRGIPFGIIYNGTYRETSDAAWLNAALQHYLSVEVESGQVPDQVIFQSWDSYPKKVLPESDPNTLTHLLNSYFRTRSALTTTYVAGQVSGQLLKSGRSPVADAIVTVSALPLTGSGVMTRYTLTGTVPAAISQALVQICVNYCGSSNTHDMGVRSLHYSDSGGKDSVLDFARGLDGWGVYGLGTASVQIAAEATANVLHTSASAAQQTYLNSATFAVAPGSSFTLTIDARVSPVSANSGMFALIFLDKVEQSRQVLLFEPGRADIGTARTAADGSYSVPYALPATGTYQIKASYAGSESLWPTMALRTVGRAD